MTKKNILLLSEIFPPQKGGSGRWFAELYPRLQQVSPHLLVGEHIEQDQIDRDLQIPVERANLSMANRCVSQLSSLRRYREIWKRTTKHVKAHNINEIHAARPLSEGLVARLTKFSTGRPYSCYVHGEDVSVAATSRELSLVTKFVLRGAKRVIANSSYTCQLLKEQWQLSDEKVTVLNPGVDLDYFKPAENVEALKQQLGWQNRRVLLTVGRLQSRKGQDMAIQALAALREQFPDLLYAIVGSGEDRPRLEKLAQELDLQSHVTFLGEIDDTTLLHCYQACDIFALPNRTIGGDVEGFGMVLLEAQACGKPVIAGRSGGTLDTLEPGVTGELLDCTSPEELTALLRDWLQDPAVPQRMAQRAREWVAARFGWPALTKQADELFN